MTVKNKIGYTPREAAWAIILEAIKDTTLNPEERLSEGERLTYDEAKSITRQICRIHNRLLEKSGLTGKEIY